MVSLLLNLRIWTEAGQTAAELHAAEPENMVYASTYAFSLYLAGQPQAAAQALRALGSQSDPVTSFAQRRITEFFSPQQETPKPHKSIWTNRQRHFFCRKNRPLVDKAKKKEI